VGKVLLV
jgi:hypothetical protein